MTKDKNQQPERTGKGEKARREREERSAKALRDNLRRRKMQVRERQETSDKNNQPDGDSSKS